MKFDVYSSARTSKPIGSMGIHEMLALTDGADFQRKWQAMKKAETDELRRKLKADLPAWCPMGITTSGRRKAEDMKPTPCLMIDIDHVKEPRLEWQAILQDYTDYLKEEGKADTLLLAHITPSGQGLRLVLGYTEDSTATVEQNIARYAGRLSLDRYGQVDYACKDLTRLSFLVPRDHLLYLGTDEKWQGMDHWPMPLSVGKENETVAEDVVVQEDLLNFEYKGHRVKDIAIKYCDYKGWPEVGERHNFYNLLIKNFRNICNNDKDILLAVLPDFGNPAAERYSQIKSICRVHTSTVIPKDFYFWLKDYGFLGKNVDDPLTEEEEKTVKGIPALPPVFKQFVGSAPDDFKVPAIFALLPILGTLTSYLRARYLDGTERSTSFFSVIYAPASYGKSFVKRLIPILLRLNRERDKVSNAREEIYLNTLRCKADSEVAPKDPHVSLRELPAINSQPELLSKMRDAEGHHIFTYEEEIDTFKKGARSGNTDKSDMIRVAWDNGEYGQAFKSANTFKGIVRLYWNILLTGTDQSVKSFFSNVEDGLVTRCSFVSLGDQSFARTQTWKELTKSDMNVINRFLERCDANTYESPLDFDTEELAGIAPKDFDRVVPWQYGFKPFKTLNMTWYNQKIEQWLERQRKQAAQEVDYARDQLRRRKGDLGFRVCMVCEALYTKPTQKDRETIWNFVEWLIDLDLENSLNLFGVQINRNMSEGIVNKRKSDTQKIFDCLPDTFTQIDVQSQLRKFNMTSPPRRVIYLWKKNNLIMKTDKDGNQNIYTKIKN